MGRSTALLAAALVAASAMACASFDPLDRRGSLEESQKKYTELIRWGEIDMAAQYVDPDLRDAFLQLAPAFANIRVTDFDVVPIDYDQAERDAAGDDDSVAVTVNYFGYSKSTLLERHFRERQEWHRVGSIANTWRVRPEFSELVESMQGATP
jgi:hypothetical protein